MIKHFYCAKYFRKVIKLLPVDYITGSNPLLQFIAVVETGQHWLQRQVWLRSKPLASVLMFVWFRVQSEGTRQTGKMGNVTGTNSLVVSGLSGQDETLWSHKELRSTKR